MFGPMTFCTPGLDCRGGRRFRHALACRPWYDVWDSKTSCKLVPLLAFLVLHDSLATLATGEENQTLGSVA
jgi:hypothetical protein